MKSVINLKEPCHGMWCLSIRCHRKGFKYFNWALIIFYLHWPKQLLCIFSWEEHRGDIWPNILECKPVICHSEECHMFLWWRWWWWGVIYIAAFQRFKYISLLACNKIFRSKNQYKCGFMKIKCVWGGRIKNTSNQLDMLMYVIDWKKITTKLYIMYSVAAGQYI